MSDFEFPSESSSPQRHEPALDSDPEALEDTEEEPTDRSLSFGRRLAELERSLNVAPEFAADALGGKSTTDREMAMRTKLLEAKWHEEKLNIQQRHDAAIRKILNRKNGEIETVKQYYRTKLKDAETLVERLEDRMRAILRDVQVAREQKERQLQEMRKQTVEAGLAKQRELDNRLKEALANFVAEKRALESEQQQTLEELRRETTSRLREVEADCVVQREQHASVMAELRSRLDALTLECDALRNAKQTAERDCAELAQALSQTGNDKELLAARCAQLEAEYTRSLDAHRDELGAVQKKYDATLAFIREERHIETSKLSASVAELDDFVGALRRDLSAKDAEFAELRRQRDADKRAADDAVRQLDEQLRSVQRSAAEADEELRKRLADAKNELRDAVAERTSLSDQLARARAEYDDAVRRARADFDALAQRTANEQGKRIAELESDLVRERAANERLVREQERATSELRDAFEHELASLRSRSEAERSEALARLAAELDAVRRARDADAEASRNALHTASSRFEERVDEAERRAAKRVGELETANRTLREELVSLRGVQQKALADAESRLSETKSRAARDHEAERLRLIEKHANELRDVQKQNSEELASLTSKLTAAQTELTHCKDHAKKTVAELKSQVTELKSELGKTREGSEQKSNGLQKRIEELVRTLNETERSNQELREELMRYHENELSIEKHLLLEDEKYKEMIRELREQYETRMQGLLPANLQRDLEDTIVALKSQVVSLQQRTALLQDELGFARAGGVWSLSSGNEPHTHAHALSTRPLTFNQGQSNPLEYYRLPLQTYSVMSIGKPGELLPKETNANGNTQAQAQQDSLTLRSRFGSMPLIDGSQSSAAASGRAAAQLPCNNSES